MSQNGKNLLIIFYSIYNNSSFYFSLVYLSNYLQIQKKTFTPNILQEKSAGESFVSNKMFFKHVLGFPILCSCFLEFEYEDLQHNY